jgi:hypothetical protein
MTSETVIRQRQRRRQRSGGAALGALVALALVGCTGHAPAPDPMTTRAPTVNRDVAQQQMVDDVEAVTGRFGGTWQPRTGPDYLEDCRLSDGDQGAEWRYLVTRSSTGDADEDF